VFEVIGDKGKKTEEGKSKGKQIEVSKKPEVYMEPANPLGKHWLTFKKYIFCYMECLAYKQF